jgi:hypothetical protein
MARIDEYPDAGSEVGGAGVQYDGTTHGEDQSFDNEAEVSEAGRSSLADRAKEAISGSPEALLGDSKAGEAVQKVQETTRKLKQAAETAKTAAAGIQSTFSAVISMIANPIFWIVTAGVLVLVLVATSVIAGTQVLGQNENAEGCVSTSSGSGVKAQASPDQTATANSIAGWATSTSFAFLGNKPMSVNQIAGIIGNWSQESKLNPAIIQGGGTASTNAEVKAMGSVGGRAVGLAQWDSGRRTQLAEFAESKGSIWSDINTQLDYFKKELDGPEGANLIAGGFNDQSKSAEDLTQIFMEKFERAGDPHMKNRTDAATAFLGTYNGGYSGATGGSCLMAKGSVNTSDAVQLAISMSLPTAEASKVSPSDPHGVTLAKAEYKAGKAKAQEKGGADPMPDLYASCDRFVATVVKNTTDPNIPWGSTSEQQSYLSSSPKWQKYTKKSEARPGDIWVTQTNGHIIFYVGNYQGRDTIAHASYLDRVAALDYAFYLDENLVDQGGRPYYGYRFIG